MEVAGRSDEIEDSCAEASGGMTASPFFLSSSLRRFLRLCGSSCADCAAIDSLTLFVLDSGVVDAELELAELAADKEESTPSLLKKPFAFWFAKKYVLCSVLEG